MFGGAYSAILLNIPGDAPAVVSTIDGYPMSRQGQGGKALFGAIFASFVGGTVGIVILTFTGAWLADLGLLFGPPETALLILLALSSIGWLLGSNPVKGLVSTLLGILIATIGIGTAFGQPRFTMGSMHLLSGISFIPLVIGMFGFAQLLDMTARKTPASEVQLGLRGSLLSLSEMRRLLPVSLRSGLLGTFSGVLPGAGATAGSFFAYILEKRVGRNRGRMGQGVLEGVAASEAGSNSATAGSYAPLLSLGIPGSTTAAVLLGGLMMWGLQPGPLLFETQPDFVWGLISSLYIGNVMAVIAAIAIVPFIMRLLWIPAGILVPIIGTVCIVAAYSVNTSFFDVFFMMGVGGIAYLLKLADYPIAPLLLAFVLAPRLETSIRQSFDISYGDPMIFLSSPLAAILIALLGMMTVLVIIQLVKGSGTDKVPGL
jgi:putative tricarboxylic transport membrane protein